MSFFDDFSAYLLGDSDRITAQINSTAKGDAHTRMDIYRYSYAYQLIDCLLEDFPAVHEILGTQTFTEVGQAYLARYPSTSYTVRHFGQHFAKFLSETAPYADYPYLWQLADFEWAKGSVFDAPDSELLTMAQLADIPANAWESMTFSFIPALQRLRYDYDIPHLWRALNTDAALDEPEPLATPQAWLVWRQDYNPHWRSLPADEDALLIRARRGDDFTALCGVLEKYYDNEEAISARAAEIVRQWLTDEVLCPRC